MQANTVIKTKINDTIRTDKPYKDVKAKVSTNVLDKDGKRSSQEGQYCLATMQFTVTVAIWRYCCAGKKTVLPDGSKYRFVFDNEIVPTNNAEIVEHVVVDVNGDAVVNAKKKNIVALKSFFTLGNIKSEEAVNELMQSKYYVIDPLKDEMTFSITIKR